ncbi:alpha-N-acetylgalactosaminide alpha-2,6-sialyltransferase 1 isoform X3 [Peromyscus maniculatus bairdii]|uniref:alpha-N-acetylgalactosaminide alpha-2,6-sialyltransferase 1 isoform X3 n=1 Tax=Peromyscus maniculatus bairdii TaxID=230844 RepID=UPI003FD1513A
MKTCFWRLPPWSPGVLLLAVLSLLFILPSFMKEPSTKPSRYQFIEKNKENPQEMLQKAIPHRPIMELPPRVRDKEKTSVRTEELGLQNQDSEAARADGEEKRKETATRTALGKRQSVTEPAAKTLVPERRGKMLTATGAVPAKDKEAPANPSPASFPHPTTQRGQRLKASNFKSEPQWDFEEVYSLDVGGLQTTCPDSLKIRASKSPWLQNLFLPNLTLFLDSGHFTRSEWNRLEHFAPPFGFMELNQSLVEKVVTRFPPVPQQQLLLASLPSGNSSCITCAVVGNGGILNDSHVGQEIDSHDYVFRLSGALIKGYEQDVGTRTSFYGFTAFSLVQSILTLGRRGFQHVPLGKAQAPGGFPGCLGHGQILVAPSRLYPLHEEQVSEVKDPGHCPLENIPSHHGSPPAPYSPSSL